MALFAGGVICAAVWAAPGAHGPGGEHLDAPGATVSVTGPSRLPDGSVVLPKAVQRRMAVRTVVAVASESAATFPLPGKVVIDPNASGRVQSVRGGRVEPGPAGMPVAGRTVRRGDVLAYVRHHADPFTLGEQRARLAELRAQRQLAEQRVQRLEGLEGTVPRKDIEAARSDARSLSERERSIGESLAAREALLAPVSGVIARADLAVGQVVEPREVLVEVVDPSRMLVEAALADAGLAGRIEAGTLRDAPGVTLRLLGAARALRDGVLPLTFAVAGAKPGMSLPLAIGQPVTVLARTRERIAGIVLPAQAVVRNPANEAIVWVKAGAERFVPLPVESRALSADTVVVTAGLSADSRVVVQGAALIAQIR